MNDDNDAPAAPNNNQPREEEDGLAQRVVDRFDNLTNDGKALLVLLILVVILSLVIIVPPDAAKNQRVSSDTIITDVEQDGSNIELTIYSDTPQTITVTNPDGSVTRTVGTVGESGRFGEQVGYPDMETITLTSPKGPVEVCDESNCVKVVG